MTKRQFHKTVIEVVVLSEEPLPDDDLTLKEIAHGITEGDWSGEWEIKSQDVLDGKQAAEELQKQGSDPGFFNLDETGNDMDVDDPNFKIELCSAQVDEILMNCLFNLGEDTKHRVDVEGITMHFGFHPERLSRYKDDINALVDQLPDSFKKEAGDSFLNMCNNSDGARWGEHEQMQNLLCLAIGIGRMAYVAPRQFWSSMPGGVPLVKILEVK